jgi:hypothetical protein
MRFPWKLIITSTLFAIILRPLFDTDTNYLLACFGVGILLPVLDIALDLGLNK